MGQENLAAVTAETLAQMREPMQKALTTGYTTATGMFGYLLEAPAKFLVPVLSPWRNRVPRHMAQVGSRNSNWRAITAINAGNLNPGVPFGAAGGVVQTQEVDYAAPYAPLALGDSVQMDAQMLARGFDDLRSRAGVNLLFALMIGEDRHLLGSQNFALQTPGTPTVTISTTGGSIPATTAVNFRVCARTIEGYFYNLSLANGTAPGAGVAAVAGGGTVPSANGTATTGAGTTSTASASVASVPGAVCYDWYAGSSATAMWFIGTTTVPASPTITALPTVDATNPTLGVPQLTAARAGGGANIGTVFVDTSADNGVTNVNSLAQNGLYATLVGDISSTGTIVQRGTGAQGSGAVFSDLAGATLTGLNGTITQIDAVLVSLYNNSRVSPTRMLMNAQQHLDVSNKMVATGTYNTFLQGADMDYRQAATGGIFLTKYINKAANGFPIEMETMPNLPPGTIILITEQLPFPSNEVSAVFDVETQQEYTQIEYAMNRQAASAAPFAGPRYDVEVRAIETFRNFFPAGCSAIQGIAAG